MYYATKLNNAPALADTRDNILIRIVVTRSEVDLKDAYAAKYEELLAEKVAAGTRGNYEAALLKIIGYNTRIHPFWTYQFKTYKALGNCFRYQGKKG
jgi:hypothetical protein